MTARIWRPKIQIRETCYKSDLLFISSGVKMDDILLKDEIFGPIMPIIEVSDFDEALGNIYTQEKPLAAYCFAKNKKIVERWVPGSKFL